MKTEMVLNQQYFMIRCLFKSPFLWYLLGILLCSISALTGCSKSDAEKATETDANGYLCGKCGEKFYTSSKVFASQCPKCKQPDIQEVVAFVCDRDGHTTIVVRGPNAIACEKCQQVVDKIKLPREKDLLAWGAKKE
jgi:DNA-directed RNA polymerase subunit RPC12/RpoP